SLYSLLLDHASYEVVVEEGERSKDFQVMLGGEAYAVEVEDERSRRLAQASRGLKPPGGHVAITAPIPGMVVKVQVDEGDSVKAGQSVMILEAMKMENELRAPRDGVVRAVLVKPGDHVDQDQVLVTLK
ncbi:MAG TPA: biotin/lipoyl-binding protein, partial [Anaerolineae bacterium]|nr:biotin/lipoyl-binding protein [Anaerolineae bacterium]